MLFRSRIVPDAQGKVRFHYVLVDFLCRRVAGELRAGGDAQEARWVRESELEELRVAEPAVQVIRKGMQRASAISITKSPDHPIVK